MLTLVSVHAPGMLHLIGSQHSTAESFPLSRGLGQALVHCVERLHSPGTEQNLLYLGMGCSLIAHCEVKLFVMSCGVSRGALPEVPVHASF